MERPFSQHSREPSSNSPAMPTAERSPSLPSTRLPQVAELSSVKGSSERSAVVLALFGPSVGPCVGDFSTTYNRVNGRLYAATRAVLFYSNLFGFERRLCLNLSDIESIEPYRATSIRINMVDCEDHVFRKFFHRDEVLKVLQDIYEKASANYLSDLPRSLIPIRTGLDATPIRRTNNTELIDMDNEDQLTRARFESDLSQPESTTEPVTLQESALRPRSHSVPSVTALLASQEKSTKALYMDSATTKTRPRKFRRARSLLPTGNKVGPTGRLPPVTTVEPSVTSEQVDDTEVSGLSAPAGFDMAKAWAEAKQPYSEVAVKNVVLSCSLEAFMDMFISNDASFPIAKYQKDHIHDRKVSYSKWKKRQGADDTKVLFPPVFDRDISFVHPLNNAVGPSQAQTNRQQNLQRFGAMGAILQNKTVVQGVPGAECFQVEDRWIVESIDDSVVQLSAYFQIVFSKRTMFKPIIQKNVKSETKKWFQGYVKFLRHVLHEDDKKEIRDTSPSPSVSDNETVTYDSVEQKVNARSLQSFVSVPNLLGLLGVILLALCLMLVQLIYVQRSVLSLQGHLISIREENNELLYRMNQILESKKCS